MQSIRALSRAIPKSAFRTSFSLLRPLSASSRTTLLRPNWKPTLKSTYSAFSTTTARREGQGDSDPELCAKLGLERQLETESRDTDSYPPSVQFFKENSPFQIEDVKGTQNVVLTRQFGNETIKVEFSISDINDLSEEMDEHDVDPALDDEDQDFDESITSQNSKRTINQSGARGGKIDVVAEDSVAPSDRPAESQEDEMDEGEEEPRAAYPISLTVTITKPTAGAVQILATAKDGIIEFDYIYYYPSAKLAEASTPEDEREAARTYTGPPFGNLDHELQAMLERYLDERGINSDLAVFLPDFVDYKEQREYVQWLDNMKNFVDA